jgi:putative CGCGG family rSAM target protein
MFGGSVSAVAGGQSSMSSDTVPPVTETDHENSWSANLELEHHADSEALVIEQAIEAVERTAPGYHVNLVTHEAHGDPADYLHPELEAAFGDAPLSWELVDQCGCGGYVTRVHRSGE